MENMHISTTQNVGLQYQPAGLGLRILSILLDTLFKYSYAFLMVVIFYETFSRLFYGSYGAYPSQGTEQVAWGLIIICLLPFVLYHLLCEALLNGQSFGKKIMKIKVVKLDGTQANFGSYLIRWIFRIIDDSIIGIVAIAVSRNAQRIGDIIAGTAVIELNSKIDLYDTILKNHDPEYKIVYSQVSLMNDKDANTIREVLLFAEAQEQPEHLRLLAERIKAKYAIYNVEQEDADFLNTLLEDYSHYQFEN